MGQGVRRVPPGFDGGCVTVTGLDATSGGVVSAEPKTEAGCVASDYVGKFDGERGEPGEIPGGLDRVTYRVEQADGVERRTRAPIAESDVVSSELFGDLDSHAPCIDLDVPAVLVPSSTPGHSHLYIDVPMTWEQYEAILTALADAGVMEQGYYRASKLRKGTHLRLPWVRKPEPPPPVVLSAPRPGDPF